MNEFIEETHEIYRLRVPFEAIYTSVFLIKTPADIILVDCAMTDKDVDYCIVPALKKMGYNLSDVGILVLTHSHRDHAGGLERVLSLSPGIEVVTDVRTICDEICTYPLSGHTEDSIGVLDIRSHTLISGDGLQGAGVDKYRCYTKYPDKYIETLKKIKSDQRIENILFSHAYEPWNTDVLFGREKVTNCIKECKKYVRR